MLWDRCGGRCEVSGRSIEFETFDAHHRRPKGMGGTRRENRDNVECLLALHPDVHNLSPDSVHLFPGWSRPRGYLVSKHTDDPGQVPVWWRGCAWVLLTPDGSYQFLPRQLWGKPLPVKHMNGRVYR